MFICCCYLEIMWYYKTVIILFIIKKDIMLDFFNVADCVDEFNLYMKALTKV